MRNRIYENSYEDGVRLANKTLEECNDENFNEIIKDCMISMYKEKCEPCGYSFSFDGWYNGYVDTMIIKYKEVPYISYERGIF